MCSQKFSRILTKRLLFLSLVVPEVSGFPEVFQSNGVAGPEGVVTPEPTDEPMNPTEWGLWVGLQTKPYGLRLHCINS